MKALVIGGGVVGLNIALALQTTHSQVSLIEARAQFEGASYGNAGHIAIEQVEPLATWPVIANAPRRLFMRGGALSLPPRAMTEWLPFSLRMMAAASPQRFAAGKVALSQLIGGAMAAWQRRLADIDATDLLRRDGHYVVWETASTARKGLANWAAADTGEARFVVVEVDEFKSVQALTRRTLHGAIRFENTGQITDTRRLLTALSERFQARGGNIRYEYVNHLVAGIDGTQVLLSAGETLNADTIVVSAGVASRPLMECVGAKVPMIAERGYHLQSARHGWPQGMPPVVFEDRSLIVTGFESGLRAASFLELNSAEALPDPRKWGRLQRHIDDLGLPFQSEPVQWVGARPTLPDYLPAIGRYGSGNLYYAFGHQHLGLTLAATTGEIVAAMVGAGKGPAAFDLKRFK